MQARLLIVLITLAALLAAPAAAQVKKKKPAARPPAKTKTSKPKPATGIKGTAQLPGDNGKLNQAYTMGVESQLNFTLRGVENTLERLNVGTTCYSPSAEQKLMLLRFTVQNPNKQDTLLRFDTFDFTAVDSKNVNHRWVGGIIKENENKDPLDVNLKPAQKVDVLTGILLPAEVSAPKLMVQHHSGGKVLRYDLRGLVKPLASPFADPTDASGQCARKEVPAEKAVYYPFCDLDVQLVSAALGGQRIGNFDAEEGRRTLIVTLTLKNATNSPHLCRFDTFGVRLIDPDGESEDIHTADLYRGNRNERAEVTLEPGASYTCRLLVPIGLQVKPGRIVLTENESHAFSFDISSAR